MQSKLLAGIACACLLPCGGYALAQTPPSAFPSATAVNPGDLLSCSQATGVAGHFASRSCTPFGIVTGAGGETVSHKGAANGYAPLDGSSHLPTTNLPALTGGDAYTTAGSGAITLNSVATAATYPKVTFNAKGLVTSGSALATTDITSGGGLLRQQASCRLVDAYGADPTGAAPSDSAVSAALAASSNTSMTCIEFGPGTYRFSGLQTFSLTGTGAEITIKGVGAATQLRWSSGNGIAINLSDTTQSFHVEDLVGTTSLATTSGNGSFITVSNTASGVQEEAYSALSTLTAVSCRGADKYAGSDFWNTCLYDNGVSNINLIGVDFTGAGSGAYGTNSTLVYVQGISSSSTYAVAINAVNSFFNFAAIGFQYGTYVQGVSLIADNFTGDTTDIYMGADAAGADGLTVVGGQFSFSAYGINLLGAMPALFVSNNIISPSVNNGVGINLSAAHFFNISGNLITGSGPSSGTIGIAVSGSIAGTTGIITGNNLAGLQYGEVLGSTSAHVNVQSNAYSNNGTNTSNAGTANTIGGGSP